MTLRRELLSYVGTGSIGAIAGYYAGVKGLLGLQSGQRAPAEAENNDRTEASPAAPSTESEQTGRLGVPFTEEFAEGLNGWTVGTRYRTGEERRPYDRTPPGDGGYSDAYGGSARLHVDGGPSTIGIGRTLAGLPAGTTVRMSYTVEADSSQPGKVGMPVFAPDGDDMADTWVVRNEGSVDPGQHTITGTVSEGFPAGSEMRVTADVWPGEFTAYITSIRVE